MSSFVYNLKSQYQDRGPFQLSIFITVRFKTDCRRWFPPNFRPNGRTRDFALALSDIICILSTLSFFQTNFSGNKHVLSKRLHRYNPDYTFTY